MDFSRIHAAIDIERVQAATVAIVGLGASRDLACNLTRCGVKRIKLLDPDVVETPNIARQGHLASDVGRTKVAAVAEALQAINPAVEVACVARDFTQLSDGELDELFAGVDLLILATDRFAAQAKGNEVALRLSIPAIWIGVYAGGLGCEVVFWRPAIDACYRCACCSRYEAHAEAAARGECLDPPSDGVTIFDVQFVDAIAGMIALGLLTRGSDTRFGRLIDELGDRNFIRVQLDPGFEVNGQSPVRKRLQVPEDCESYFAWTAAVERDPTASTWPCPDCQRFRGHELKVFPDGPRRMKPRPEVATKDSAGVRSEG